MKANTLLLNEENQQIMYALKDKRGKIMLFTLAGTEMACKDCFEYWAGMKLSHPEFQGYETVKLSIQFEVID